MAETKREKIVKMRVVVLADNRAVDAGFGAEHGLSIYLETESYKCLLDVGASDLFARNAKLMNIDISDVDYLFISHGQLNGRYVAQQLMFHERRLDVFGLYLLLHSHSPPFCVK